MRLALLSSIVPIVVLLGCGGTVDDGAGGSGSTGTASSGNVSSTGSGGGVACPGVPPANGSPCSLRDTDDELRALADCAWGLDPRPACRIAGRCTESSVWEITEPSSDDCAEPPLPAACSESPPDAGTACEDPDLACWYAEGARCACSPCEGGSEYPVCQPIDPPAWACALPAEGCPATIPQAGAPCATDGLSCGPDCELEVVCEGGAWRWRQGECPICASPDTSIATPTGEVPIADLRPGDLVFSVDGDALVAVPIARVGSTPVARHRVVRLTLDSGRVLEMSGGHPTADGRRFDRLRVGDRLDASARIVAVEVVPFEHARTHDILPASSSGSYVAAGALVGSTLRTAAP
jgi:hypothetical protein